MIARIRQWVYLLRVRRDHRRWPLGTRVLILPGHHSPEAVGILARVGKHGYPCKPGVNCIVDFPHPVMDVSFGAPRYSHYVAFRHLQKVEGQRS